jgi:alpha-D-ribose 1-methylphosphonate 5-triphosphate synthase subunit PhnH
MTQSDISDIRDIGDIISPGFAEPVLDSQRVFRRILEALARPGRIQQLSGAVQVAGLNPATVAICLTLLDFETRIWLDAAVGPHGARYLSFHCNSPRVDAPERADFAIIADPARMPSLDSFMSGSDDYPERSTTLIVQAAALRPQAGWRLRGAGIETHHDIAIDGLPDSFWLQLQQSRAWFPRGIDILFTRADRVVAIPRTTQLEAP